MRSHPAARPAGEALMHRLVLAVALRQVRPVRARPQNPQNTVHEQPVIRSSPAGIRWFARQQRFDPLPLPIAQLV